MQEKDFENWLYLTLPRKELKKIPKIVETIKPEDYDGFLQDIKNYPLHRVELHYAWKNFKDEADRVFGITKFLDWILAKLNKAVSPFFKKS